VVSFSHGVLQTRFVVKNIVVKRWRFNKKTAKKSQSMVVSTPRLVLVFAAVLLLGSIVVLVRSSGGTQAVVSDGQAPGPELHASTAARLRRLRSLAERTVVRPMTVVGSMPPGEKQSLQDADIPERFKKSFVPPPPVSKEFLPRCQQASTVPR
jgi:hypothetical protein